MTEEMTEEITAEELRHIWGFLSPDERLDGFHLLSREGAEELLLSLSPADQARLILSFQPSEERTWVRYLPPDDLTDLIQHAPQEKRDELLNHTDDSTRRQVSALLAYAEDEAGGLMNPLYVRLRPEMTVEEAIRYLRKQTHQQSRSIYYAYVLDSNQRLLGVVSFRQLMAAPADKRVDEVMRPHPICVSDTTDQEAIGRMFQKHRFMAIPVVDDNNCMQGIVTLNDILSVVQEEATEDIQKIGGVEALDEPYLEIGFFKMIKKRAGWLTLLFVGEMATASVMGYFEDEIAKAVVLALFLPLIISSGGNSGSQATTLMIRALALKEVRLSDWWRVLRREVFLGLALGSLLALIGFVRIVFWPTRTELYGEHFVLVGLTVAGSLLGIVLWGTLMGTLLPLVLKRFKLDPASASAPFVATMVDVTGIIIYFTVATKVLGGVLL